MSFGSFDEAGVTQPMAAINTTPLVDVMLVLLVIFIISAPLFHQAVPIDLPQSPPPSWMTSRKSSNWRLISTALFS